jgi:hypothetical protein
MERSTGQPPPPVQTKFLRFPHPVSLGHRIDGLAPVRERLPLRARYDPRGGARPCGGKTCLVRYVLVISTSIIGCVRRAIPLRPGWKLKNASQGLVLLQALADQDRQEKSTLIASLAEAISRGEAPLAPPEALFWDKVQHWWPFEMLRAAAAESATEEYHELLHNFLIALDVKPPESGLWTLRGPGRPRKTEALYNAWINMGRPRLGVARLDVLANLFYHKEFVKARSDMILRKKLRDRVRTIVHRYEKASLATKSPAIS